MKNLKSSLFLALFSLIIGLRTNPLLAMGFVNNAPWEEQLSKGMQEGLDPEVLEKLKTAWEDHKKVVEVRLGSWFSLSGSVVMKNLVDKIFSKRSQLLTCVFEQGLTIAKTTKNIDSIMTYIHENQCNLASRIGNSKFESILEGLKDHLIGIAPGKLKRAADAESQLRHMLNFIFVAMIQDTYDVLSKMGWLVTEPIKTQVNSKVNQIITANSANLQQEVDDSTLEMITTKLNMDTQATVAMYIKWCLQCLFDNWLDEEIDSGAFHILQKRWVIDEVRQDRIAAEIRRTKKEIIAEKRRAERNAIAVARSALAKPVGALQAFTSGEVQEAGRNHMATDVVLQAPQVSVPQAETCCVEQCDSDSLIIISDEPGEYDRLKAMLETLGFKQGGMQWYSPNGLIFENIERIKHILAHRRGGTFPDEKERHSTFNSESEAEILALIDATWGNVDKTKGRYNRLTDNTVYSAKVKNSIGVDGEKHILIAVNEWFKVKRDNKEYVHILTAYPYTPEQGK